MIKLIHLSLVQLILTELDYFFRDLIPDTTVMRLLSSNKLIFLSREMMLLIVLLTFLLISFDDNVELSV